MKKSTRKLKAEETLKIIEEGSYTTSLGKEILIKKQIKKAIENTKLYSSEKLENLKNNLVFEKEYNTIINVVKEDAISTIHRITNEEKNSKVMCLNFASAKNPGGGFLNGALAQEESLAVSSTLYGSQVSAYCFYDTHRNMKSCVYTDTMIHSPETPVFRNRRGELITNYSECGFITSAAVNYGVIKRKETDLIKEVEKIMSVRIEKLLSLCYKENYDTLILGAWGCGVFQNDPKTIARLFKEHFNEKFKNQFKRVVFAIYSKNEKFIKAFKDEFQ